MSRIFLTKKDLASVAGYTYRRLHDIDNALPEDSKLFVEGEGGKYDLAIFVQRWVKYNVDNEAECERSLDEAKTLHEIIKTRKTELEVAKLEGRLVDINEIRRIWGGVANTVMQNMIRLPSKVAPRLIMMGNSDLIAGILDEEIRTVLNAIADTPLPSEVQDGSNEEAEDEEG